MYYTVKVDNSWGDTKEREYMIRKKRIDEYILKIKPNLLKNQFNKFGFFVLECEKC